MQVWPQPDSEPSTDGCFLVLPLQILCERVEVFPSLVVETKSRSRADIYPLLRFGRFRPFNAWGDFNKYIVSGSVVHSAVVPTLS